MENQEKRTSEQLAWLIRRHGVEMTHLSHGSHIGPILSVADIVAVLYADVLRFDANNPKWTGRDRFILSKGHAGASVYSALAESGFFPVEELKTHYQNGSKLSGHVSHKVNGVEVSTGSLGHGLSIGAGMAIALKQDKSASKVYVVLGDGECDEGAVWEAALFANHFRLSNLVAVIDYNNMQSIDTCENTLELKNLADKWRAFGWNVFEVDGHDHGELKSAFKNAGINDKPTVIIAHTVKGKGVSFMENDILWHYRFPHDGWEYICAVNELHSVKPDGVTDPYTPDGLDRSVQPDKSAIKDNTMSATYKPTFFSKEK